MLLILHQKRHESIVCLELGGGHKYIENMAGSVISALRYLESVYL